MCAKNKMIYKSFYKEKIYKDYIAYYFTMVEYDTFKKIADKLEDFKESAFPKFGLKGDIRYINSSELPSLLVKHKGETNFEEYSEKIILEIGKLMKSQVKTNKKIAIVGPQGSGKTTLILDIKDSIEEQQMRGEFSYLNKIEVIQALPLKLLIDEKIDLIGMLSKNSKINNVLFFDDCQEVFFPSKKKTISNDFFESINNKINNLEQSACIFTFNSFGWKLASSKILDLANYFDEIIWMDGLEDSELKDLIEKRLCYFSINKLNPVRINDLFENEELFKIIIKYSSRNPRLVIGLVADCIVQAFEKKFNKINLEVVNKILENEGVDQFEIVKEKELLNNKVLFYMLSYPVISVGILSKFLNLDKTTIRRELDKQIEVKRIFREKNEENNKEFNYGIRKIVRAVLESILMQKIKGKAELFRS